MTGTRVLTALVLVPVVVAAVWWGPSWLIAILVGVVTLLAMFEFFALGARIGMRGYRLWTCFCALLLLSHQWGVAKRFMSDPGMNPFRHLSEFANSVMPTELILCVFVLGAALIALASRRPIAEGLPAIGISAAGLLFVALPFSYIVLLHSTGALGPKLLLFVLVLVWVGDTAAYFIGRAIGRHPMAAQLSPKKTWEGAIANLLGSMLVAVAFYRWIAPLPVLFGAAALGNIAGQIGDLVESAYKRSAGVKESGGLLPGHGGMLDRIDALILAAPVVWYYFLLARLR